MNSNILLENVSYTYPNSENKVLKEISCEIEEGKFTVVLGRTGAGKTTMMLLLNGIIPQLLEGKLEGKIHVANLDLSKYRVQTITRNVGLVLQDPESQIFGRTVEEDVSFGPRNYLVPRDEIFKRIDESLARVRLSGYNKRMTSQLSGGEKQRLAIAGVIAMHPSVLVLDEPTSELDPLGRDEIYKTIQDLSNEKNLTILVVEHSSQEICERADNIVVVNDGRIAWTGKPKDLFRDIEVVNKNGIKPIPVSIIGWTLYKKGYIKKEEIPLESNQAFDIIKGLLKGRKIIDNSANREIYNETGTNKKQIVEVKDLTYTYESGKKALDDISITIHEGDFVALIGQNGAGKTTLAKHFNSIFKPASGKVFVCGKDTADYEPENLAQYIGYVFQNPDHQIFSSTVYKELEFGLKNTGLPPEETVKRISEVMEITGISHLKDEHPFSLGKGERQKIAVASILALNPQILVVDEPTTGQDWDGINAMMNLIDTLHKKGTTIIMITHDMDVVARYAKRTIVLNEGKVIADGNTADVLADTATLNKSFVDTPQIIELSKLLMELGLKHIETDVELLTDLVVNSLEEEAC